MANRLNAAESSGAPAAAQPSTGGSAPGIAPTAVQNDVRRLRGV